MSFNLTGIIDGNVGAAQGKTGTTIETFVISLASGFLLFAVQFTIFLFIRIYPWAKRIYQPRSFLVPLKNRVKPPPSNPIKWIVTVFQIPAPEVILKSGMDGYFFLRYLGMCLKIFFPMALIILPILLPINVSNGKGTSTINDVKYNITGLDTLAWSNVSPEHTKRYWAHLVLAIGVIAWVCFLFHHELMHYIGKRQEYLGHPGHRLKASATTVLITDIPLDLCTVEKLTEHYDDFPGGVRRIWINQDFEPLVKKVKQRNMFESKLENAETNLIRKCVKEHRKIKTRQEIGSGSEGSLKRGGGYAMQDLNEKKPQSLRASTTSKDEILPRPSESNEATVAEMCSSDLQQDLDSKAAWTKYMSPSERPTTRIPDGDHTTLFKIPLLGRFFSKKVDTIYYSRRQLGRMNVEIEKELEVSETYPHIRSAFIQFNTQKAAHLACQGLSHSLPKMMTRRTVELAPGDINWPNLAFSWWERYIRLGGFMLLFVTLLFLFGAVSFFTGILSKISTLAGSTSWLHWIVELPSWAISFIQGTLPPVILIIILSGPLPIFLRLFSNDIQGAATGTAGEISLQLWYFIFLLFELFIVPTISSGLTAVVKELIQNPTSVPNILAQNLPTAADYYFSFLIVEALSISASSILQTIRLLNYYVLGSVNTPDSVFRSLTFTNRTRIGSNIPWYTTYAVIGLVYSVIAPLMLIFMLITFGLFWFVIKNNILYVVRTGNVDGGGLFFPSAINQTFTGLYFMEFCLIGLFFLVRDTKGDVVCEAQGIIMAAALVGTAYYQWWLYSTFSPLYTYFPITMEGQAQGRDREYELERLRARDKIEEADEDLTIDSTMGGSVGKPADALGQGWPKGISMAEETEETEDGVRGREEMIKRESVTARPKTSQTAAPMLRRASDRADTMQRQQERDGQSAKRILARLNRPLDESRLAELEESLVQAEHSVGNVLVPHQADVEQQMMNDSISKIIMQHNDELEDLDAEERDLLISVAFTHPVLRQARPSVWIPRDDIGVSDDEVKRTRERNSEVVIDNKGAFFDRKLRVDVNRSPPDMSEFALLMSEL